MEFYQPVHALLSPAAKVIDFGAGRGVFLEDPVAFQRDLRRLKDRAGKVRLDLDYIERWSLATDLVIIAKTAKAVALRRGAC